MPWQLIGAAIVGACVGSFINVLSLRFGKSHARLLDRSRCPHCGKALRWWELIPVLSFIFLRARCARCHHSIHWQYPLVEIITAAAWLWVAAAGSGIRFTQLTLAAILTVLILLWVIDAQQLLLPDIYLVYLVLFVVLHLWSTSSVSAAGALPGAALSSLVLLAIWAATQGRGLGFGDVKLALPLGLLFGLPGILTVLVLAFMAGGASAAYLLLTRQAHLKTAVPFGPYLITAAFAVLLEPRLIAALFALFPAS